ADFLAGRLDFKTRELGDVDRVDQRRKDRGLDVVEVFRAPDAGLLRGRRFRSRRSIALGFRGLRRRGRRDLWRNDSRYVRRRRRGGLAAKGVRSGTTTLAEHAFPRQ